MLQQDAHDLGITAAAAHSDEFFRRLTAPRSPISLAEFSAMKADVYPDIDYPALGGGPGPLECLAIENGFPWPFKTYVPPPRVEAREIDNTGAP